MATQKTLAVARSRRKKRIRRKVVGTAARPRLTVFRSARHIYGQLVDDGSGVTLCSASTLSPELREHEGYSGNRGAAEAVGRLLAEKAKGADISRVVFDRNGYLFHGRVKALADGAREGGLDF